MTHPQHRSLSRREREIVDILYRLGEASASDVLDAMADPPGNSAVRALLRLLEEKGHLRHRREGRRYLYAPKVSPAKASRSALRHVVQTFFGGSAELTVASLLDQEAARMSQAELDRLAERIEAVRNDNKKQG